MYYSISKSKSKFYSTSKEPRDGYEKVIYGTDNSVTYHKYIDEIQGALVKVSIDQKTVRGAELAFLTLEFKNSDGYADFLSCALKEYGRFTEQTKTLASALANAEFGENYRLTCRTKKSATSDKSFLNIYFNYTDKLDENNRLMSTGYIPPSEVPKGEIVTDELGQKSTNYDNQNKFFTNVLSNIIKKSNEYNEKRPASPTQNTPRTEMVDPLLNARPTANALEEFLNS